MNENEGVSMPMKAYANETIYIINVTAVVLIIYYSCVIWIYRSCCIDLELHSAVIYLLIVP